MEVNAKSIKEVAEKVRKRTNEELPMLKGMLEALSSSGDNIQLLPQVIHTIAVVYPDEAYVFLEGANTIFEELVANGKPNSVDRLLWKSAKRAFTIINKLHKQEQEEYIKQLAFYKQRIKKLKEQDETLDEDEMLCEDIRNFQHVVYDSSNIVQLFIYIMILGYAPSKLQINTLQDMIKKAKELLTEAIAKHENILNTTAQILD